MRLPVPNKLLGTTGTSTTIWIKSSHHPSTVINKLLQQTLPDLYFWLDFTSCLKVRVERDAFSLQGEGKEMVMKTLAASAANLTTDTKLLNKLG